jgi:RHS repeat-associated protein
MRAVGNGAPTGSLTYNLRFPGQFFENQTGLHYNYLRDYDPRTGRYIESDPIGIEGGINTYLYVGGRPTMFYDFAGADPVPAGGAPPGITNKTPAEFQFQPKQTYKLPDDWTIYVEKPHWIMIKDACGRDVMPVRAGNGYYKKNPRTGKMEPVTWEQWRSQTDKGTPFYVRVGTEPGGDSGTVGAPGQEQSIENFNDRDSGGEQMEVHGKIHTGY